MNFENRLPHENQDSLSVSVKGSIGKQIKMSLLVRPDLLWWPLRRLSICMVCDDRSGGPVLDVEWWGWRRGIAVLLNRFEPVDQRVRRGQTLMLTLKKLAGNSEIRFISIPSLPGNKR